jgi:DNA-directed RNA polymerase specialized sigma24 family protein
MTTAQPPEGGDPPRADWADEQVTRLFRGHYLHFYDMIKNKGFSEADSHDIVNDSGAAFYKHLVERGPIEGNPVAYFTRMVQNRAKDYKRRREPVDLVGEEVLAALTADPTPVPPETATPLSPEHRELLSAAHAALDDLPDYLWEPYEMAVYGRLEPAEIARILNKPAGRIRSYLSIARAFVEKRVAERSQLSVGGRAEDDE